MAFLMPGLGSSIYTHSIGSCLGFPLPEASQSSRFGESTAVSLLPIQFMTRARLQSLLRGSLLQRTPTTTVLMTGNAPPICASLMCQTRRELPFAEHAFGKFG